MTPTPLQKVTALADDVAARQMDQPVMPWMWGPALQGWALALLQERLGERRYEPWLNRFCGHYLQQPPEVHSSDTAAPALITYELQRQGEVRYAGLTDAVVGYVREAPRLVGGAVDHLGTSGYARFYPDSVWVDSLMMFGVFAARWAADHGDRDLLSDAADQPAAFARLLRDPSTGLWAHSWWAPSWHAALGGRSDDGGRRFPRNVPWARGNGWVVAALPMLLELLPEDAAFVERREEIVRLFREISEAMLLRQRADGAWTTVLTGWPKGYPEVSSAALVACGWFTGIRLGVLDRETYEEPARRASEYALGGIRRNRAGELELTGVSGPTIPVPVLPRAGYLVIPRGTDLPWGVAAVILAALAEDRL